MITYELAKQLKDAGFPQVQPHSALLDFKDCTKPTLEELIDVCEGYLSFFEIVRSAEWEAIGRTKGNLIISGKGETPSEAVSRLFIKLKEI